MTRPVRPNTAFVHRVLRHLEAAGATWAPRALGIEEQGLEVLSWIPGETPATGDDVDVPALARIVRDFHDLTVGLVEGSECVIHDDLQPRNTVVQGRQPIGLIDWEQARPGRRVEDVANLCWSFIEPTPGSDPSEIGRRWRHVIDAYGLDDRTTVVATVLARTATCAEHIEREAARGSTKHQSLAGRGDHVAIRAIHAWVAEHARFLDTALVADWDACRGVGQAKGGPDRPPPLANRVPLSGAIREIERPSGHSCIHAVGAGSRGNEPTTSPPVVSRSSRERNGAGRMRRRRSAMIQRDG